jgi:hypothetical protein
MDSFFVVDLLDKVFYVVACLVEIWIFVHVDLFVFYCFYEAFCKRIVKWVSPWSEPLFLCL